MPASCSASSAAWPDRGMCSASTGGHAFTRWLSWLVVFPPPHRAAGRQGRTEGGRGRGGSGAEAARGLSRRRECPDGAGDGGFAGPLVRGGLEELPHRGLRSPGCSDGLAAGRAAALRNVQGWTRRNVWCLANFSGMRSPSFLDVVYRGITREEQLDAWSWTDKLCVIVAACSISARPEIHPDPPRSSSPPALRAAHTTLPCKPKHLQLRHCPHQPLNHEAWPHR